MKRKWIILVVILVVLAAAFLIRGCTATKGNQVRSYDQPVNPNMVMKVENGELEKTVSATGYLAPKDIKTLSFTQIGKIAQVYVQDDDQVQKGDPLVRLDQKTQELNYIRAQRAYEAAKINGSPADLREQEANLKIAKDELDAALLTAPFSGRVTELKPGTGDYVTAGQAVLQLVDDSGYKVEVSVDESESHLIEVGQPVKITMDAFPGETFAGKVTEISYQTQNVNGIVNVPVTVVLTDMNSAFRPGYSTQLEIVVSSLADQILVPVTAIFTDQGEQTVMKVVNNRPVPTKVQTGVSNGVETVITGGIQPGDTVVTNAYIYAGIDPAEQQRQLIMGGGNRNGSRGGM